MIHWPSSCHVSLLTTTNVMKARRSVRFFALIALVVISIPLVLITFSMMLYFCPMQHELAPTEGINLSLGDILLRPTTTPETSRKHSRRRRLSNNDLPQHFSNEVERTDHFDIPKVIYQTYQHKDRIPPKVAENFAKYAIGYQRFVYDDAECLLFLKTHYHPAVTKTFHLLGGDLNTTSIIKRTHTLPSLPIKSTLMTFQYILSKLSITPSHQRCSSS